MSHPSRLWLTLAWSAALGAGPIETGMAEFREALRARGRKPEQMRVRLEMADGAPGSWRIEGTRISGGDQAGIMYGLFEAAEQIRSKGFLSAARGTPALPVRGVRLELGSDAPSPEEWREYLRMLAHSRINRLQLVTAGEEVDFEYLAGLSKMCAEHGVEFTLGLPESPLEGIAQYERLKQIFSRLKLVRSVHLRVAPEAGEELYRDWLLRAAAEAGRWVTLEFAGNAPGGGAGVRVALPYREDPGEAAGNAYYEVRSPLEMGAPVWGDPDWARHVAGVIARTGALGFEIAAPWPWRPHWFFYAVWGRAGYDPRVPGKTMAALFERRYGKQPGAGLYEAWTSASRAFSLGALFQPGPWVATAEEAERLRREGTGSAKLTPADLRRAIREAAGEARKRLGLVDAEAAAGLEALLEAAGRQGMEEADGSIPRKPLPKTVFRHYPPRVAPANIKFPLGLIVEPAANAKLVRLHYRPAGSTGSFRTLEAAPSRAWFQVESASDLIYYFEIVSKDNRGWFYPDPLAGAPYFSLPVRPRRPESSGAPQS